MCWYSGGTDSKCFDACVRVCSWVTVFVCASAFDLEQCQAGANRELSALIARTVANIPKFHEDPFWRMERERARRARDSI